MSTVENDPATMTPEQRFQEVAAILAHGVLRLRAAIPNIPEGVYGDPRIGRLILPSSSDRRAA